MAKDFAELNRLDHEAGIQAPEAGRKQDLVNKFVKAWENETARRAVKGGTGLSMALTLAACGGSSGGGFAFAPSTQGNAAPTTPIQNLIALVDGGITAISGADPIVEVASPTAGADALSTTIGAGGTGTLTLRFADADDVVTLDAASDLSGYDTLAIAAGTVDVTAVDLTGITSITVSSGVTLTAAQFLGLSGGVTGGSTDSSVTIIVSTAAEAADVIAAAASLSGTFAANGIVIQGADGSGITAAQADGFTAQLEAAIEAAATVEGLPQAIQAVVDAAAAQDAFVETALANDAVVAQLANLQGGAVAEADAVYADADAAIDLAVTAAEQAANTTLTNDGLQTAGFNGENGAAIVAEFDAIIATETTDLNDARDALSAIDAELVTLANAVIAAQDAKDAADTAQTEAEAATDAAIAAAVDGTAASITFANDTLTIDGNDDGQNPVDFAELDVNGNLVLNASVTLDAQAGTYTVDGVEFAVADLDAVVTAAQAELDAIAAATDAGTSLTESQTALDDAEALANAAAEGEAYINAEAALTAAQEAKAAFEADVADYDALVALQEQTTALDTAVTDALAGIENAPDADPAGFSIDVVGDNGAGAVDMQVGGNATSADDLYFLDLADANNGTITVSNFAFDGLDRIYTGAEGNYSFVELGADQAITDAVGSATTLEIFAKQNGNDVDLYVEGIPTAGNGSTAEDTTTVTLTGVDLADLSFDAVTDILSAEAVPAA